MNIQHTNKHHQNNNKEYNHYFLKTAIVFFLFGFFIHWVLSSPVDTHHNKKDFSLFWKVWDIMEEKYPFEQPSFNKKKYDAIQGLVYAYGDEHTVFFPPEYAKQFSEDVGGEFGGAGMEVGVREGLPVVIAPLKDSPAEKAGFKPGDILVDVGGTSVLGKNITDVIDMIRGEVGTRVDIQVVREGAKKPITLHLTRGLIKIPVFETKKIDDTFVISLYNFNRNAIKEFHKALEEFKSSGLHRLLIDLRNNPGGYMLEANELLSYFIPKGEVIVKEDFGKLQQKKEIYRSKGFHFLDDYPYTLAVLINRGSASASEIVAGALQDYHDALIIGEKSYGKGSVQELIDLDEGASLKVTVAHWLTPQDHQISKKGIQPDVVIQDMEEKDENDVLQEAVKLFQKNNITTKEKKDK